MLLEQTENPYDKMEYLYATNGMQFQPIAQDGNRISIYDNQYVRQLGFDFQSGPSEKIKGLEIKKF